MKKKRKKWDICDDLADIKDSSSIATLRECSAIIFCKNNDTEPNC